MWHVYLQPINFGFAAQGNKKFWFSRPQFSTACRQALAHCWLLNWQRPLPTSTPSSITTAIRPYPSSPSWSADFRKTVERVTAEGQGTQRFHWTHLRIFRLLRFNPDRASRYQKNRKRLLKVVDFSGKNRILFSFCSRVAQQFCQSVLQEYS